MKEYFVYILANKTRTVNYIGVTNDLMLRVLQHKQHTHDGFTAQYNVTHLMHYEKFNDINQAIAREKQLKGWRKEWKWDLVKEHNPELKDLAADWYTADDLRP